MLGRLLNTRLRAAETALREGRLDEAYRISIAPDLRGDRSGMALLARLAERLVERAREHFAADRFAEALADLDRAEAGDVLQDRIRELRQQVQTVAEEVARQELSRHERLEQARRRVAEGSLEAGRRILEEASEGDAAAHRMKRELEMRDHEASEAFAQVEQLIRAEQWRAAVERLTKAKALDPLDPACVKLEAELCGRILDNVRQAFREGRIERAADELAFLGEMGQAVTARRDVEDMVRLVRQAAEAFRNGDYDGARQSILRLQHLVPEVAWVPKVIEQLRTVDELLTALRAGPLGAWEQGRPTGREPRGLTGLARAPVHRLAHPVAPPPLVLRPNLAETVALTTTPRVSVLPDRLLLLVDGGGSYLLLRKDRVSIGKAATSNPADIALFAELADRHADLVRVEEDYFLFSAYDVEVGGRMTRHQLLRDGDRLVLGRKAKCTFRLPSRKSASAVLDLSDTSKLAHGVRRAVLFDQTATVGCGPSFHVQCQLARDPLVLFERGGTLWVRRAGRDATETDAVPLELGKTIEMEGVTMTAKPWPK